MLAIDADSHFMEPLDLFERYIDPKFRERFVELAGAKAILPEWSTTIQAMQDDPEFRAGDEANLLLRKNYQALGAFRVSCVICPSRAASSVT